jgi:hypothetical protein
MTEVDVKQCLDFARILTTSLALAQFGIKVVVKEAYFVLAWRQLLVWRRETYLEFRPIQCLAGWKGTTQEFGVKI